MILDYLLQPLSTRFGFRLRLHYVPRVPFVVWALLIAGIMTVLNLIGVKASDRKQSAVGNYVGGCGRLHRLALKFCMAAKAGLGYFLCSRFMIRNFRFAQDSGCTTSFAALTYIGFDGVTTLARTWRIEAQFCWQSY
jgi:hypothetical protein